MMPRATAVARSLLSVLVTLRGRVSERRPVCFLGRRKRTPRLNPSGGRWPLRIALSTDPRRPPFPSPFSPPPGSKGYSGGVDPVEPGTAIFPPDFLKDLSSHTLFQSHIAVGIPDN